MKRESGKRYKRFYEALVAARNDAGLSQEDVAKRLGRPQSYISKCERGERRMDVIEFLEIADAIGFDPVRFLNKLKVK